MTRAELLERHGRAYGALRLAVTFTAGLEGDDAKRVTARGWDTTRPLGDPEQGAAIVRHRGERSNPAIVLQPSGLVGVDIDGPEGVELLRRRAKLLLCPRLTASWPQYTSPLTGSSIRRTALHSRV